MSRHKGFTLIELILVIIVLGVIAVTTAPKFIDLQSDARNATLKGMKSAVDSSLILAHAKLAIHNLSNSIYVPDGVDSLFAGCVGSCSFRNGYPSANTDALITIVDGVSNIVGAADWVYLKATSTSENGAGERIIVGIIAPQSNITGSGNTGSLIDENSCYLRYINYLAKPLPPRVEIVACL